MRLCLLLTVVAVLLTLTFSAHADSELMTVDMVVSPSNVYLDSQGVWVTVHADIPYSEVTGVSVTLNGISVAITKSDSRGDLVAKFYLDDVKAELPTGRVTLRLFGETEQDGTFEGFDEIVVMAEGKGR